MAIYHYHVETGKRVEGKNAVFASAYIRREKRQCERVGETKDFSQKGDLIFKDTILPEDAPTWAKALRASKEKTAGDKFQVEHDGRSFSEYAWNQIEFIEKRSDSQLYLHHDIALPIELNQEQAIELVKDFVKSDIAINGYFADVAVHSDKENPHFHILTPAYRTLTDEGFSKKVRVSPKSISQELHRIRQAWSQRANEHLRTHGIDARIDHRSYEEQGIDLTPTVKEGKVGYIKNSETHARKLKENAEIRKNNAVKIAENPQILTNKILNERESFDSDYAKNEINRLCLDELKSDGSTDQNQQTAKGDKVDIEGVPCPILKELLTEISDQEAIISKRDIESKVFNVAKSDEDFNRIYQAVINHESLYNLGLGEDGREHFVSKSAFELEKNIVNTASEMAAKNTFLVASALLKSVSKEYGLNESQTHALKHIVHSGDCSIITGYAGTGKTYLLKAAHEIWAKSGYKVYGVAFSGRASSSLQAETGIESFTIAKFTSAIKSQKRTIGNKHIVVMDEMGMTSLDDMSAVLDIVKNNNAKFAGVGDTEQTQPVGRGAPMRSMIKAIGNVFLDNIMRQKVDWQREATVWAETNKTALAFDAYNSRGYIKLYDNDDIAHSGLIDKWKESLSLNAPPAALKESILICHQNQTVNELNKLAREHLLEGGVIKEGPIFKTNDGKLNLSIGDRVLFGKNDYFRGLRNGEFGTITKIDGTKLTVMLDKDKSVTFDITKYNHIKHGYAATVHKLQGYTGDNAFVMVDGKGWDRHLFLVAASRHRESLYLAGSNQTFKDMESIKASVSRHGLNDTVYDYPVSFAISRGFNESDVCKKASGKLAGAKQKIVDAVGYLFNVQSAVKGDSEVHELKHQALADRRQKAVKVANFVDNRIAIARLLEKASKQDDDAKQELQNKIYSIQLNNAQIAKEITTNIDEYKTAISHNRLEQEAIDKAVEFDKSHKYVSGLINEYEKGKLSSISDCYELVTNLSKYYGHIVNGELSEIERRSFMQYVNNQADNKRYELAFEKYGLENRTDIKKCRLYKQLNYEISLILKVFDKDNALDKTKERLNFLSAKRNELASQIENIDAEIIADFNIDIERLRAQSAKHQDFMLVKEYQALLQEGSNNIRCALLASRIKAEPKRYGVYVYQLFDDGFKSIGLQNYLFEKRNKYHDGTNELKNTINEVERYQSLNRQVASLWSKAIRKLNAKSQNADKAILQAKGMSYLRSKAAHQILNNMEQYTAALSLSKVDIKTIIKHASGVDLINKYRNTQSQTVKTHLACYMLDNYKIYQHGLAVFGLEKECRKLKFERLYLDKVTNANSLFDKELIKLARAYKEKAIQCGKAYSDVKAAKRCALPHQGLKKQAQKYLEQRNRSAEELLSHIGESLNAVNVQSTLGSFKIDKNKLQKASIQHKGFTVIQSYLRADAYERAQLAKEILNTKAWYHLVYQYGLDFKQLSVESKSAHKYVAQNSDARHLDTQKTYWDYGKINDALMTNIETSYIAIFGEPKERGSNYLKWSGGVVLTTKGSDAGLWYDHQCEKGGGPIQAIQHYHGLNIKDALEMGAQISNLSYSDAKVAHPNVEPRIIQKASDTDEQSLIYKNIQSAKSIWDGAINAKGTLAETYLKQHRGIDSIDNMSIRYLPPNTPWLSVNDNHEFEEKLNKMPVLVIGAFDKNNNVTGVQRVYLDKKTADKATFMKNPKLSKGQIKGSPGVVQQGKKGGVVILAEGPETACSIASLYPSATVLTTFSVSNIKSATDVINNYEPRKVIVAADFDGELSKTKAQTIKAVQFLRDNGLTAYAAFPKGIEGKNKTDWNDVLKAKGKVNLKLEFEQAVSEGSLSFEYGKSLPYTKTEQFLREECALINVDLSDVRQISESNKGLEFALKLSNESGGVCGERLYQTDGKSIISFKDNKLTDGAGFILSQEKEHYRLYITDNLIDAKSIGVGDKSATIVIANNEDELKAISSYVSNKPYIKEIAFVSDSFSNTAKTEILEKSANFADLDKEVYITKGRSDSDNITHCSINEALRLEEKVKDKMYIQSARIDALKEQKTTLKSSLSRLIRRQKHQSEESATVRPVLQDKQSYYIKVSESFKKQVKAHIEILNSRMQADSNTQCAASINSAVILSKEAKALYKEATRSRQSIDSALLPNRNIFAIDESINKNECISLHDLKALTDCPRGITIDSETKKVVTSIYNDIIDNKLNKVQASAFVKDKAELLTALNEHRYLLSSSAYDDTELAKVHRKVDAILNSIETKSKTEKISRKKHI